jgi:hypothetical protein
MAKKEGDGSAVVQFDGCDGERPNCLPIMCSAATVLGGTVGAIGGFR